MLPSSCFFTLLFILKMMVASVDATDYLEPEIQRHAGVLPKDVCKQLIELGEKAGFLVERESIDSKEQNNPNEKYVPSQTIDVYLKGWAEPGLQIPETGHVVRIVNEEIWKVLEPFIPFLTKTVEVNRDNETFRKYFPDDPNREPELNWVFFRKYSPSEARNSLKPHVDTNMHTLNIELSDDYEGGGWFYVKPSAIQEFEAADGRPDIKEEYRNYEWTNEVRRKNTTEIIFPSLMAGDALLYNFTVYHGVAPVESGTRYAMSFFYDHDNPAIYGDGNDNYSTDEIYSGNEDDSFKITLHNSLSDTILDIMLVYDGHRQKEVSEMLFDKFIPDETASYDAYEGDLLHILIAGTDKVVSKIEVKHGQVMYEIDGVSTDEL
mmetsp:Transcript_3776/g.8342  ORF Transcript_3776/g.8342 Transcript_3776/m.8342 type:complete len:378 (+) Transcript_3776:217-1350(+)